MEKNKSIDALSEPAKTRIRKFIEARNTTDNIKIWVTETMRTIEQQKEYVKSWVSKTMNSNHLSGKAIDIFFNLPGDIYLSKRKDWDVIWRSLCALANKFWLVNGYYDLNWWFDKPHFQIWEVQKPEGQITSWYLVAKEYKEVSEEELNAAKRSIEWNSNLWKFVDPETKDKLFQMNTYLRNKYLLWK